MRTRWLCLFSVGVLGFVSVARAQGPEPTCLEVAITDKTGVASPLDFSGSAMLCESEEGTELAYWYSGSFLAHNHTEKGFLAAVLIIDMDFPHREKAENRLQTDNFFGRVLKASPWPEPDSFQSTVTKVPLPNVPLAAPAASAKVAFIEFEDGTFFGDPASASDLFDVRGRLLNALRSIDAAYTRGGEKAFVEALQQNTGRVEVENVLAGFRNTQKNSGTVNALKAIRKVLESAAGRPQTLLSDLRR